ncbi:hypothetical protein EAI_15513 [Harpegnathos saltator]|uniref:Uncharacterized protein n=1 Tax=Harpegnathos saltator TaxID=610380 RepID=E2BVP2_HARSA|nr:hypothetical protein EAI_15513 [Harpegnathos saltator]
MAAVTLRTCPEKNGPGARLEPGPRGYYRTLEPSRPLSPIAKLEPGPCGCYRTLQPPKRPPPPIASRRHVYG